MPSPSPTPSPAPAAAPVSTVDWRANLTCDPDQQQYDGVLYCTGTDDTGQTAHVVIVDLKVEQVSFEVILPKGYSEVHSGEGECRDPNVPAWGGPEGGCSQGPDTPDLFPAIALDEAALRAKEIRSDPALAAVINADYAAPDLTHGPEGLLVVRGERLDGAAHCDDDHNAALRPWLGLGDRLDEATGLIRATIDRLPTDGSDPPGWLYTGIGGGPWLIREGQILPGAATCDGETTLGTVEPVANCTGNPKPDPSPPLWEAYGAGSCRAAPHTAAGLSQDQRWLFLVMTTGESTPDTIAKFMRDQLGVWQALKFDGGSSSKLMYMTETPVRVESVQNGELTNYLGIYAATGHGIRLPLAAEPRERVYYRVVTVGETAQFDLAFGNSGSLTWFPDDQVELQREHWFLPSRSESLTLTRAVAPGESFSWTYEVDAEGVTYQRFQMVQRGEAFGSEAAVIVIALPEEWADRRDELERELQEMVDGWKARGEQELDRLMDEMQERAERELQKWLDRTISRVKEWFREQSQRTCNSIGLTLGTLVAAAIFARRVAKR